MGRDRTPTHRTGGSVTTAKQELIALGRTIRTIRRERNIKAGDLATAAEIVPRHLAAIEAGTSDPSYDVLLALARGLGIEPGVLVGRASNLDTSAACAAFARRLRKLRTERDISQVYLARRAGLHRTQISKLELGEREPRLGTLLRLAYGLDVPPDALLKGLRARRK
jgi:transcriptional regulator with XRE-family HTH domain